jgi:hypothetical protein
MDLTDAAIFGAVKALLNHNISKDVDKVGEFETTNSTITLRAGSYWFTNTRSRHLTKPR